MGSNKARANGSGNADWTTGPAKWGGAGFLGGSALVGLIWVLGARESAPIVQRAPASVVIGSEDLVRAQAPAPDQTAEAPVALALAPEPATPIDAPALAREPDPEVDPTPIPEPETEIIIYDALPSLTPSISDDDPLPESPLPREPEQADAEPAPAPEPASDEGSGLAIRIRINTATAAELDLLPGIGPVIAQRIIDDRAAKGRFRNLNDLQRVRGIGPKTAEKLAPHVRFD